jgi:hypothetical protein
MIAQSSTFTHLPPSYFLYLFNTLMSSFSSSLVCPPSYFLSLYFFTSKARMQRRKTGFADMLKAAAQTVKVEANTVSAFTDGIDGDGV